MWLTLLSIIWDNIIIFYHIIILKLDWYALSAYHSALFNLKPVFISINNVILYCRLNKVITRFEFK